MRLRFRYVLVALAALLAGFLLGIPRVHAQTVATIATIANCGAVGIGELDTLHRNGSGAPLPVL